MRYLSKKRTRAVLGLDTTRHDTSNSHKRAKLHLSRKDRAHSVRGSLPSCARNANKKHGKAGVELYHANDERGCGDRSTSKHESRFLPTDLAHATLIYCYRYLVLFLSRRFAPAAPPLITTKGGQNWNEKTAAHASEKREKRQPTPLACWDVAGLQIPTVYRWSADPRRDPKFRREGGPAYAWGTHGDGICHTQNRPFLFFFGT